jgi:hypothetical protein
VYVVEQNQRARRPTASGVVPYASTLSSLSTEPATGTCGYDRWPGPGAIVKQIAAERDGDAGDGVRADAKTNVLPCESVAMRLS